ncbi:cytochrome c biogenesis protein CcdA [Candidatus Margulisiibacteriota bacterium]
METIQLLLERFLAQNIFIALALAYLGGLLTTFTPCVYPMIPVTLAITLGTETADEKDKWKKLINPCFYCLGITTTYALLGIFAAVTGTLFGTWASNPWIYFALGAVLIVLSLNMLGVIALPTLQVQYKANRASKPSLFVFGALTGAAFSPCTIPILSIFLVYAATKNILVGGLLLFSFAAGFSSLLLLMAWASLYAKDKIPRSGRWLEVVKRAVVTICSLTALYFLFKAYVLFTGRIL